MSTVHRTVVAHGQGHMLSPALTLAVVGGGLLAFHLGRALLVRESTAARWLRWRGLTQDPRSTELTVQYLLRLRWARAAATLLMIGVCALAAMLTKAWISFVSLPFLLSVLLAESLAPEPRRGRVRTASLERRTGSFFAPVLPLLISRLAIIVSVLLVAAALILRTSSQLGPLALHGAVLLVGLVALESCLLQVSRRALPDRNPDLALDTAMRVSSA